MKYTDLLGLPWPETDDTAALALYMEELAYLLEGKLTEITASTDGFVDRPCGYWINNALALGAASTALDPEWDYFTWDTPAVAFVGDNPTPADATVIRMPVARTGLWAIGASAPVLSAGTPTENTWRYLVMECLGRRPDGVEILYSGPRRTIDSTLIFRNDGTVASHEIESNQGTPGSPLTVDTIAWIPPDAYYDPARVGYAELRCSLHHTNTGSGITAGAGTVLMWAVWLGYGQDVIEQLGG